MKSSSLLRLWASFSLLAAPGPFTVYSATAPTDPTASQTNGAWFDFAPPADPFGRESAIDLSSLNETVAGDHGFIGVKEGHFIHTATGLPERFWAVNGPPHGMSGKELQQCARLLAKYGVNLVRVHGGYFDKNGAVDPAKVQHALEIVEAMKAEGIYTLFSIYFPLWHTPQADNAALVGYDGKKHPFATLFFNAAFQEQYRAWWKALLTTPSAKTGKTLLEDPAVAGLEMQNEDSFFFWTFSEGNLPEEQWQLLEKLFGDWLTKKYGSLAAALQEWKGAGIKRDAPKKGRMGFRPLYNIAHEKTARDRDTARFLLELQTRFYSETHAYLRRLGFKAPITASNWATASPEVLGPLEKLSYTAGDFLDRHGYFNCNHKGPDSAWSIRPGHTYSDRSALRFEGEEPTRPKQFVHPVMDPHYAGKPSMVSETTWNRPNRFRSEAPLYFAAYGALQESDAIVHFALDGAGWSVKPGFWMQPWTLATPAMMGQFPAAALIYRRGLLQPGKVLAQVELNVEDLLQLKGTPLPQDAALDELRLKDVPRGTLLQPGQRLDPLLHFAGRAEVLFTNGPARVTLTDLTSLIDHTAQTVTSSTGQLKLDYGRGLLLLNAPQVQGVSGLLSTRGTVETTDLTFSSDLELGHLVAVSLDNLPLATSRRILLQVMSEEQPTGFRTEPVSPTVKRIVQIGTDPWQVKALRGQVRFKRSDAASLQVTALDLNGYPAGPAGRGDQIQLRPDTLYYLISR